VSNWGLRVLDIDLPSSDATSAASIEAALKAAGASLRALTLSWPGVRDQTGALAFIPSVCPALRVLHVNRAHDLRMQDLRKLSKLVAVDVGCIDMCDPAMFVLHAVELMSLGRLRFLSMGDETAWPQEVRHSLNVRRLLTRLTDTVARVATLRHLARPQCGRQASDRVRDMTRRGVRRAVDVGSWCSGGGCTDRRTTRATRHATTRVHDHQTKSLTSER